MELLDLTVPFSDIAPWEVPAKLKQGETPKINPEWDQLMQDLMRKCWSKDPKQRPSASEVHEGLRKLALGESLFRGYELVKSGKIQFFQ